MGNFWEDWVKTSNDLFASWMKTSSSMAAFTPSSSSGKNRFLDSLETIIARWQSTSSAFNDPQMAEAIFQGVNILPEVF
jgi:hypothetical protein